MHITIYAYKYIYIDRLFMNPEWAPSYLRLLGEAPVVSLYPLCVWDACAGVGNISGYFCSTSVCFSGCIWDEV